MVERYWKDDEAEIARHQTELESLERMFSPGNTVTPEGSAMVDDLTRKLLERLWRDHQGAPDRHREVVRKLLSQTQALRQRISRFSGTKYNEEYQHWLISWRGGV